MRRCVALRLIPVINLLYGYRSLAQQYVSAEHCSQAHLQIPHVERAVNPSLALSWATSHPGKAPSSPAFTCLAT
jgi:hypothetical protein